MMKRLLQTVAAIAALTLFVGAASADRLDGVEGAHGLAMHGDLKYPPGFTHFNYVNPDAPKGGLVRQHAIGTFDSFNSFIIKGNRASGVGFTYNTLMAGSADEAFSQYGELAEQVYIPKDRSWVAFKLRKDARWHDGKPVTPADVIWTFNTLVEKGSPFYRFYYGSVARVSEVAERTVRFDFKPGENQELPLILGQLTVLPKHYWASRDFSQTTTEPPLGSGPYKITSFEAGRFITFERVKDYWGQNLPAHKGFYNFDTIRIDYYRDSTVALEAFKAGEYDYRNEHSSKNWARGYTGRPFKRGWIIKEEIEHDRPAGMQGFVFNSRRELFQDRRVRHALSHAFDFEWSNRFLFYGQYARTKSYFDNSELAARGTPSPEELEILEPHRDKLPPEVFTGVLAPPVAGDYRKLRGNLRAAIKLLEAAGWRIKDGKLRHDGTGKAMSFEILLVSPLFERVVLPYINNLRKLGIEARVRTVDPSQYRRRLNTYDYDVIVFGFGQSLSPGNEQRNYWGSKAADLEGGRNFIGIKDPVMDELIEKIIAAPTRKALVTATRAMDRVLQWNHWVVPHWHAKYDRVAYWTKFGRPKVTPVQGNQFFAWWIDPARLEKLKNR